MKCSNGRGIGWFRGLVLGGLVAVAAQFGASEASAGNVGTITVAAPTPIFMDGLGGEEISATRNVNLAGTCLAGASLRWMQLATVTYPLGPVTPPGFVGPPAPNLGAPGFANTTTFLDPIPGQPIGGGLMGDNLPFYDVTYNGKGGALQQNGSGSYVYDAPRLPYALLAANGALPFTVTFQTILVAATGMNNTTLNVLGGYQWGFTLNRNKMGANQPPAFQPVTALAWANINQMTWQTSLNQWFGAAPGPYTFQQAVCPMAQGGTLTLTVSSLPEPSTIVLAVIGLPGMMIVALRHRRRRAA
jgi:hypothetical protein